MDVQASEEEANYTSAGEAVTESQIVIQHPISYDQYDLCAMAKDDTLNMFKLLMLQHVCGRLGLDVPRQ